MLTSNLIFILFTLSNLINGSKSKRPAALLDSFDRWNYPTAPRDDSFVEKIHNFQIKDPFKIFENSFDLKTIRFMKDQHIFAVKYLNEDSKKMEIRNKLMEYLNYERFTQRQLMNDTIYQIFNPGNFTQGILTRQKGSGPHETVVDPRFLFEKDFTKIQNYKVTKDQKYLIVSLRRKGSDWEFIKVKDLKNDQWMKDEIVWSKFNDKIQLDFAEEGFYYAKFKHPEGLSTNDAGLENSRSQYLGLAHHKIGTPQTSDKIVKPVSAMDEKEEGLVDHIHVINSRYFIITTKSQPSSEDSSVSPLVSRARLVDQHSRELESNFILSDLEDNYLEFVSSNEVGMYFISDIQNSNRELIFVKFDSLHQFETVVPAITNGILYQTVIGNNNKLLGLYHWEGVAKMELFDSNSKQSLGNVEIPFGDVTSAKFNENDTIITFDLSSFLYVSQTYEYNLETSALNLKSTKNIPDFNGEDFVQYKTYYKSKDGVQIPILLAHSKNLNPDQSQLGLLYGYGGFNIQNNPGFRPHWAYMIKEMGMVVGVALVRGGGERGEKWYTAATKLNKQVSYNDFEAAVNFLQSDSKYGFVKKGGIFINGASNGGLMSGAVCNQIPNKLGGCIVEVGVHDLLRYHQFTVGAGWESDYGRSDQTNEEFQNLMKLSPLENVLPSSSQQKSAYPPYLIHTGQYDDRVSPLHSLKLAAKLQSNHRNSSNVILLYPAYNSGHSPSNLDVTLDLYTNQISFINLSN